MLHACMASTNRADRLAILPFIACRGQTPLQNGKAGAQSDSHIFASDWLPLQPSHYKFAYSTDFDCTELLDVFSPSDALHVKYPLSPITIYATK
jgi:hypothetical protein